jgi:DNA polymerase IV
MFVSRKIIHIDMDAFYASVEQRDQPRYRGKPLVVGGLPSQRGVIAAASYEARQFGIHSAMPSRTAVQKCPHLIFVRPRFEVYQEISDQIRAIFARYTDLIEPLALDEAYLDVTENKLNLPSATWIARAIKQAIYQDTQLTASAGVSINKFLAKIASGINKPNGLFLIPPEQAEAFIEQLPIEKFYGIGQVTAAKMHQLGIRNGQDLKQWSEVELIKRFGKVGSFYFHIARAQDHRSVQPNRMHKSIGAENSFESDLQNHADLVMALTEIAEILKQRLEQKQIGGRTLTLKVKYGDYQQVTRSRTLPYSIIDTKTILTLAQELLSLTEVDHKPVRLLGLTISNLEQETSQEEYVQLCLWSDPRFCYSDAYR